MLFRSGVSHAYVVFATRDPSAGTAGISAFLVMKDDPGVSFGRKEDKMGVRGSPTREVVLEGCRIPVDRLIGEEGRGFAYAMKTLDQSRPAVGAQAVGIAQGAFDVAVRYAMEREQFGKPLADLEAIRIMLADMAMKIEASRMLVYRALAACDADDPRPAAAQAGRWKKFATTSTLRRRSSSSTPSESSPASASGEARPAPRRSRPKKFAP